MGGPPALPADSRAIRARNSSVIPTEAKRSGGTLCVVVVPSTRIAVLRDLCGNSPRSLRSLLERLHHNGRMVGTVWAGVSTHASVAVEERRFSAALPQIREGLQPRWAARRCHPRMIPGTS